MNMPNGGDASSQTPRKRLPAKPSFEHLQKQAKALAKQTPGQKLAAAQHQLAQSYGFKNWPELARAVKAQPEAPERPAIETETIDEQIVAAVMENNLSTLRQLLDAHPDKITITGGTWSKPLLHCAAWEGRLEIARELLQRGADVNARCETDHACAIHFAAERGHLDIVRLLADAGADLEAGDNDHQLNVLGWATCFGQCQEDVARFLLSRGATMTLWSAVALNDAAAVRELVAEDPALLRARMSRNEYHRTPLHQAVHRNRYDMVELLLELGADPNARDSLGLHSAGAGNASTDEEIVKVLDAAGREPNLQAALALGRYDEAERLLAADPNSIKPGGSQTALFVHAVCRKDWRSAEWLLTRGADIDALAEVYQCPATALHFAIESAPNERVQWLLDQDADTSIPDGKFHNDALGWARFFGKQELIALIEEHRRTHKVNSNK
ncbi:MAG: ankyrin repeat domain-containing protein [Opitutales bacterium]